MSTSHADLGLGHGIDNMLSGLGASIARMVQFIEVENGGYSVLFSDHYRKCCTTLRHDFHFPVIVSILMILRRHGDAGTLLFDARGRFVRGRR